MGGKILVSNFFSFDEFTTLDLKRIIMAKY